MKYFLKKMKDKIIKDDVKEAKLNSFHQILNWHKNAGAFPEYPTNIQIELSNICNAKCAMCATFSPFTGNQLFFKKENAFFDLDNIKKLEDILKHCFYVSLFGYSEPLLHPQFAECLKIMKKYQVYTTFFTNAKLLTKETAELIVDCNVASITISFSGADKETYENIYLNCNFEESINNIQYLNEYKKKKKKKFPIIEINSLGFQKHVEKLDDFVKIMDKIGVNTVYLKPLYESAEQMPVLYRQACVVRPDKELKIIEKAKKYCESHKITFFDSLTQDFLANNDEEYEKMHNILSNNHNGANTYEIHDLHKFKEMADKVKRPACDLNEAYKKETLMTSDSKEICEEVLQFKEFNTDFHYTQPHTVMYIRQNGSVKPCCNFRVPKKQDSIKLLGNITNEDAKEIFNSNAFNLMKANALKAIYPSSDDTNNGGIVGGCTNCIHYKSYPPSDTYIDVIEQFAAYYKKVYHDKTFSKLIPKLSAKSK